MSNFDRYKLNKSANVKQYEFISKGPNGEFKKIIQFTPIFLKNVYTLTFGNLVEDGKIDDFTTTNNEDRNKILATIAEAVLDFTNHHPNSLIFFAGSTESRTRLYRMALTINFEELSKDFEIWGVFEDESLELFDSCQNYIGFLINRK